MGIFLDKSGEASRSEGVGLSYRVKVALNSFIWLVCVGVEGAQGIEGGAQRGHLSRFISAWHQV